MLSRTVTILFLVASTLASGLVAGCASLTGVTPGLETPKTRKIASNEDPVVVCAGRAKAAVLEAGYALRNLDNSVPGLSVAQGNATYFLPLLKTLRTESQDKVAAVQLRLADCEVLAIELFTRDAPGERAER